MERRLPLFVLVLSLLVAACTEREIKSVETRYSVREKPKPEEKPQSLMERVRELRAKLLEAPRDVDAHYELGRVYEHQGQLALADVHFRQMLSLLGDHEDPAPYYWLGRVKTRQAEFKEALVFLKEALACPTPPKAPEWHVLNRHYRESAYLIGKIYYHLGDEPLAKSYFNLFVEYGGSRSRLVEFLAGMGEG